MTKEQLMKSLENCTPEDEVKVSISVFTLINGIDPICVAEFLGDIDRVVDGGWPIILESSIQTKIVLKSI